MVLRFSFLALALLASPAFAAVPFTLSPETTAITTPLWPDGSVNYIQALNNKYGEGVKPEENAFTAWAEIPGIAAEFPPKTRDQILQMCRASRLPGNPKRLSFSLFLKNRGLSDEAANAVSNDSDKPRKQLWDEKDFPLYADYLKESGTLLDQAAAAAARPKYWLPEVSADGRSLMMVLFPSLGAMRETTNWLASRATFRAKAGNFPGFLSDITAIKQFAAHLAAQPTLIERLVGYAMDGVAADAAGTVAGSGILTAPQCADLAKIWQSFPPLPSIDDVLDTTERWFCLDSIQLLAIGRPDLVGPTLNFQNNGNPFTRLDPSFVDWDVLLRRMNSYYDAMVKGAKLDFPTAAEAAINSVGTHAKRIDPAAFSLEKNADETREAYTQRIGDVLTGMFVSILGPAIFIARVSHMQDEMIALLISAAAYHATHNAWPDTLETLNVSIPKDIYSVTGTDNIKYAYQDGGILIYSVGRNHIDEHGQSSSATHTDDITFGIHPPAHLPDWATP